MQNLARHVSPQATPQSRPIPGREADMSPNNAGGVGFKLDDWSRLDRFLVMGSEGGTHYVGEKELTIQNAAVVIRCLGKDGPRTVARIVEISDEGRAVKNDAAILALAMAATHPAAGNGWLASRQAARAALPKVCRTGTHLLQFVAAVQQIGRWSYGLRQAVGRWFTQKPVDKLALQLVKYRNRAGFMPRDVLRLTHPNFLRADGDGPMRTAVLEWACRGAAALDKDGTVDVSWRVRGKPVAGSAPARAPVPALVAAHEALQKETDANRAAELIRAFNLPRESVPTELLSRKEVWAALLEGMPVTAMVRNLGKMTAVGLLEPMTPQVGKVVTTLTSPEQIARSRIHPVALMIAAKIYAQGRGDKGKLTWNPVGGIVDALDEAHELAYANVEPTNKRILVGIDISGSMTHACSGVKALSCAEACAAVALVLARTEPNVEVVGFASRIHAALKLTGKARLDDVIRNWPGLGEGTDCALPVRHALDRGLQVDAFLLLTDGESWAGNMHCSTALEEYRRKNNPKAKLIMLSAAANHASLVDPADPLQLGIAGFDAAAPELIAAFLKG